MKIMKNIIYSFQKIIGVSKSILLMMFVFVVVNAMVTLIDLFFVNYIIDYALSDKFQINVLLLILGIYFCGMAVFRIVTNIITGICINKFEVKLKLHTMSEIYRKSTEIDIINYNDENFYNKLNRAFQESEARYFMIFMQVFSLVTNIIIFTSVFAIYNDALILVAVAINVIVFITYYFRANKKKYDFEKKEEKFFRYEDYIGRIFTEKEYAQELRVSPGIQRKVLDKYASITEAFVGNYRLYLKKLMRSSVLMTTVTYMIYWVSSLYISSMLFDVKISVGDFLVLMSVVSTMSQHLISVLQILPDIYQSSLYIDDINEIINFESAFSNQNKVSLSGCFHDIRFESVCFKYNEKSSFELCDVSFSICSNEVTAIVGLNGSGKTTIIDCILGLIKPNQGNITLNGINYEQYDINYIRNQFSVVFQDYKVYETSIGENILMHEITSEEDVNTIHEALKYVGLYEKVISLKEGIHAIISSDNSDVEFSGGELQRIVIARAYAKPAPILVFDEPTSALDVYATNFFYDEMFEMKNKQGRSIVFTSHKLHQVVRADKIIYMEQGKVAEVGTHEQLMNLNQGYAALYRMQAKELFARE